MGTRKRVVAVAVTAIAMLLSLAACSGSQGGAQTPVPSVGASSTPTPTPSVSVSVSVSPGPTETVYTSSPGPTDDDSSEPSDDSPPRPEQIDETIYLSGPIILINRAEKSDGSCTDRITDVVVDVSADDDEGIKLAHIHGRITIDAKLDGMLRVGISPSNFEDKLTVLEHGEEGFPEASDLTGCDNVKHSDVLDPFYGQWVVKGLPYNGETWFNL